MKNKYYESYTNLDDELEHYGVLGMKWGVRRYQNKDGSLTSSGKRHAKEQKSVKKYIYIGSAVAVSGLAIYGGYRYAKFIKDKNVSIAIENGKKYAAKMKQMDIGIAKKNPDLFDIKPDSYYEKYIKDFESKARSQSLSEAYKNVKAVADSKKKLSAEHKRLVNSAKKTIKELRTGKLGFGTMHSFNMMQQYNPDILKELGISVSNGNIFLNGKQIY